MIQHENFEQTHELPADPPAREALAWKLGHDSWDEAERRLNALRSEVQRIADGVLLAGSLPLVKERISDTWKMPPISQKRIE